MTAFVRTLRSEWLKRRRSAATLLVLLSALFVPAIILLARLSRRAALPALYAKSGFWEFSWRQSHEAVAIILLPILAVLLTSLVVQIEGRNNAWKQLHATPQPLPAIFAAKLLVILASLAAFFAWLDAAVYVAAMLPALLVAGVPLPAEPFPLGLFAARSLSLFVDALPIVALQYALALHIRNFTVPLGIGLGLWLAAIGGLTWKHIYVIPYGYDTIDFLMMTGQRSFALPAQPTHLAIAFFAILSMIGLVMYSTKSDRG